MLTSTGKQRQRKMTKREYDAAALRGNTLLHVEERLRSAFRHYFTTSAGLWDNLPYKTRCTITQETFYKWLRNWAEMGRLVRKEHSRGWYIWSSYSLPETTETEAN